MPQRRQYTKFYSLFTTLLNYHIAELPNQYCPVNYFESTGLRKMALRKLAYEALKEKHHIPKSEHAIWSKVALMPVFIQLMELVFLSRGRQFLVIFLQP